MGGSRMSGPYVGLHRRRWEAKTQELLANHPLEVEEVVEVVLSCWNVIFETSIGGKARIGVHIFPRPQIMGMFLHELIPLEFAERYPGIWRREQSVDEKDLVYIPDPSQSVEIKTRPAHLEFLATGATLSPGSCLRRRSRATTSLSISASSMPPIAAPA